MEDRHNPLVALAFRPVVDALVAFDGAADADVEGDVAPADGVSRRALAEEVADYMEAAVAEHEAVRDGLSVSLVALGVAVEGSAMLDAVLEVLRERCDVGDAR